MSIPLAEFGLVGDGVTDDTEAMKKAAHHTSETGELLTDEGGKDYLVTESITFHSKANVDLFNSTISGHVIVSKKEAGTMRLSIKDGGIVVKRLPKASRAQLRAAWCSLGIRLAGDIEACELDLEARTCEMGVYVGVGDNNATLDECNVTVRAYDVDSCLSIVSENRQITGRFAVYCESVRKDAVILTGACQVVIGGFLRSVCQSPYTAAIKVLGSAGKPDVTLDSPTIIGKRVEGTRPLDASGFRGLRGSFQATNF